MKIEPFYTFVLSNKFFWDRFIYRFVFFFFKFQSKADRFYLGGLVKILRNDVILLKKMNSNVIQRTKEHDYPFICRLIDAVFEKGELSASTASNPNLKKTAYARLNREKFSFVEGIYLTFIEIN